MIKVKLKNHDYEYDITQLLLVFFNEIEFDKFDEISSNDYYLENELIDLNDEVIVNNKLYKNNELIDENTVKRENKSDIDLFIRNYHKRIIKFSIYKLISKYENPHSKWGILTGMRPVKVIHKYIDSGFSNEEIINILKKDYLMDNSKIKLILNIANRERNFIYPIDNNKISIYISIPFCMTRCTYCSFPSNIFHKKKNLIPEYLENLKYEITETLNKAYDNGYEIDSVYIGGGTPSVLDESQLKELLSFINEIVDMRKVLEFTYEAGRPNTITKEKLKIMKDYNIDRICLNPQTLENSILEKINRDHNKEDIFEKYKLIKSFDFNSINMDLILGLPNQKIEDFINTIKSIKKLKPDNITVHSLAIKRGSHLSNKGYQFEDIRETENMMEYARKYLEDIYNPYYMYRQKNIIGNLENIGFSLDKKESLYNIKIIEERHTIMAFGAGAVSKFAYPNSDRFDRVANSKGVEDYMKRIDEMIERKLEAIDKIRK